MAHDVVTGDANLARAAALVDALVAGGVRHACLSPGSRSTPIALALARHPRIKLQVHLDERSSAFVALGIAEATGVPAIVACTSGTAAAELFPAVVEASQARVPMLLLTADRPPRLRGTGANQTIDQVDLYGGHVRRFVDAPLEGSPEDWGVIGTAAIAAATGDLPGPVHLNLPFDEPLVPETEADHVERVMGDARSATAPRAAASATRSVEAEGVLLAGRALDADRGLVVVGSLPGPRTRLLDLADRLGWLVLAEPASGLRLPGRALAAGQHLVASEAWFAAHRPQVILQVGAAPTTRTTQRLVASAERLVVVDRLHPDPDPEGRAELRLWDDPSALAAALLQLVPQHPAAAAATWRAEWEHADDLARTAIDRALDGSDQPFEGRLARDVAAAIPDHGTLFVGNSMPVRDLDAFMAPRLGLRVLANRGASGIDGLLSTALGVASVVRRPSRAANDLEPPGIEVFHYPMVRTVALLGDLSFLHDAGALLWNGARELDLVLVVANNDGGGVFDFTGQTALREHERLFVTPHGRDLAALAAAAGIGYERVEHATEVVAALEEAMDAHGIRLLEVPVDRTANVARHAEVQAAVDAALA